MSFFSNRPVLVVGGFGFIGGNMTERLIELGARVTVATRSIERHRQAAIAIESRGARIVEADLRDAERMRDAVRGQELIVDFAGRSGAVRSMEDPWTDLDVNCRGSLVLLEALRTHNRDARLLFIGSRLEYGRVGEKPVGETHALEPLCVHGIHKLVVEQYLRLYGQLFSLKFTVARLTNPYGPGQPSSRTDYGVVNRLIHLALNDDVLPIYGDGRQRRDYIYLDDAVTALLQLATSAVAEGRAYNVGTGSGTRLVDMARSIIDIAGGGRIQQLPWPRLAEQIETGDFVADISRIRADVGWRPSIALHDGLRRTVAFYRAQVAS